MAQDPYTKTLLTGRIFQWLRDHLPGARQGPVLSFECAGFEHLKATALATSLGEALTQFPNTFDHQYLYCHKTYLRKII